MADKDDKADKEKQPERKKHPDEDANLANYSQSTIEQKTIEQKERMHFEISSLEKKILDIITKEGSHCLVMPKQNENVLQRNIILASSSERSAVLYNITLTFESKNECEEVETGQKNKRGLKRWYLFVDIEHGKILDKKISSGNEKQGHSYATTSYILVDAEKSNKAKREILSAIEGALLENVSKKNRKRHIAQFQIQMGGKTVIKTGYKLKYEDVGKIQRLKAMGELMMDAEKQYEKWTKETRETLKFEKQFSEFMNSLDGNYPT